MAPLAHRFKRHKGPKRDADLSLLCVNCRGQGHVRHECPVAWPGESAWQAWAHTTHRSKRIDELTKHASAEVCERCRKLDLLSMFDGELPWKTANDIDCEVAQKTQYCHDLGTVGTTRFKASCPVCVCLFGLAPNPYSDEEHFYLFSDWTIRRVEGLAQIDVEKRGEYDRCISMVSTKKGEPLEHREALGDALCLLRDDEKENRPPLGGQLIDRKEVNIDLLKRFVATCDRLHPLTCAPRPSDNLKVIKLIDVESRKVILYPGPHCQYLALSYVWGDFDSSSYTESDSLGKIPRTIEDAMTITRIFGRRYLWVDLFCIDQHNAEEKHRQIELMSSIYGGAVATIIAMSSATMESGLPRVPGSNDTAQPQLSCTIDGKRLIGLMPTLSQQIHNCKWGRRAWTLQEALLSPRCLYITDHQVYFECNAMQCSESLDERSSWIHQSLRDLKAVKSDPNGYIYGHGTLHKTYEGEGRPRDHMEICGVLLGLYSIREMTDDRDVLFAYTGILQHLTNLAYPEGFFWGHPLPEFNWSLMWFHTGRHSQRYGDFPRWSWTAWKGQTYPCYPANIYASQRYWTHFFAWGVMNGATQQLYPCSLTDTDGKHHKELFGKETIFDRICDMFLEQEVSLGDLRTAQSLGHFILECAICTLELTYIQRNYQWSYPPTLFHDVDMNGVDCILRSNPRDLNATQSGKKITLRNLALAGRHQSDLNDGWVFLYLFQIRFEKGDSTRGSRNGLVYEIMIPRDQPQALDAFTVSRRQIIMT